MVLDLNVPEWLQAKCAAWQDRLHMGEWDVTLRLALTLDNNEDCKGLCEQYQDINLGRITLRADVEDNREWEQTLVHELLHIKHSRVDAVIDRVLEPQLNASTAIIQTVYRLAMEPFIESMAKSLVEMHRGK